MSLLRRTLSCIVLCCLIAPSASLAQPAPRLRVAVAANFKQTLEQLGAAFGTQRAQLVISTGASGMLYSQIVQGAPFDLFFSADVERAERLEREGLIAPDSRFTYAAGRLVFWSPGKAPSSVSNGLRAQSLRTLAIANPKLAPYGLAAQQVLEREQLWSTPPFRVVQGESLSQTFQFIASGNANAGFIALSQVYESRGQRGAPRENEFIIVDAALHAPIEQQAVILRAAQDNALAREFMDFVRSDAGRRVIAAAGYVF